MQRRDYTHIRSVTNARVAPAILLTIILGNLLCRVAGMVANVLGQHGLDGDKPTGQVTLVSNAPQKIAHHWGKKFRSIWQLLLIIYLRF